QFCLTVVREDDDRDVPCDPVGAEVLEHRESVHLGEPDVEEDDVGHLALGVIEALLAGLRDGHPIAVQLQLELVHLGHRRIVLDEQDVYVLVDYLTHIPSLTKPPAFPRRSGLMDETAAFPRRSGLMTPDGKMDIMPVTFPPCPLVAS